MSTTLVQPVIATPAVHRITPDDWERFRIIRARGLATDPHAFLGSTDESEIAWKERFQSPDAYFLAAVEHDEFMSVAGLIKTHPGTWELAAVYTVPEKRNQGMAQKLILQLIADAKNFGVEKIDLFVNQTQKHAFEIYSRMGFHIVKEVENTMADGIRHREYLMERDMHALA